MSGNTLGGYAEVWWILVGEWTSWGVSRMCKISPSRLNETFSSWRILKHKYDKIVVKKPTCLSIIGGGYGYALELMLCEQS